ncbi:hypothetical protein DXG03_002564 [Asterophora parasitica]|uniref:Uncharacterized protein n=1 Tax=Asterophora parasitica TaxID=117018 RepID=A0A9P7K8M0_9AGAR|nr:hypothetical protein DXG03_002564 [Asterophora parasitica]
MGKLKQLAKRLRSKFSPSPSRESGNRQAERPLDTEDPSSNVVNAGTLSDQATASTVESTTATPSLISGPIDTPSALHTTGGRAPAADTPSGNLSMDSALSRWGNTFAGTFSMDSTLDHHDGVQSVSSSAAPTVVGASSAETRHLAAAAPTRAEIAQSEATDDVTQRQIASSLVSVAGMGTIVPRRRMTAVQDQGPQVDVPAPASESSNLVSPELLLPASPPVDTPHTSAAKETVRTVWKGAKLLLAKAERFLEGTPFQAPIGILNVLFEVGDVIADNRNALQDQVEQTANRLSIVNAALLDAEANDTSVRLQTFAEKLVREAQLLEKMKGKRMWKQVIDHEEDSKKIAESFRRIDEHTKDFHLDVAISIERNTSDLQEALFVSTTSPELASLPSFTL